MSTENEDQSFTKAEVLNFDIMWTEQVRQKHKIWNDGMLSYHTRNEKWKLHDDTGHLVVSTYLSSFFIFILILR